MKIKNVIILSIAVVSITVFWLMPNIGKGVEEKYVRYYEDTDLQPVIYEKVALISKDTVEKRRPKRYKKEVIQPKKERKVSAKMFSRAIQFEPVLEQDTLSEELAKVDSLAKVQ